MNNRIAIAGAGPVGQALGRALQKCGGEVCCVASRTPEHARCAAAFVGGGATAVTYREISARATHVLIAVSDRAIEAVAEEIARGGAGVRAALHTCGSYGPEALATLAAAGVSCGCLHPLQTVRDPERGMDDLRGAAFAIDGDAEALAWAAEIATAFGGPVLRIKAEARPLYHAAAVMASNYVAVLLDAAEELLLRAGVPREDALRAAAPLARTSLENALRDGPVAALTGPVARGDAATVAAHLSALEGAAPSAAELYRAAGVHALSMAVRRGLGAEEAEQVRRALVARK